METLDYDRALIMFSFLHSSRRSISRRSILCAALLAFLSACAGGGPVPVVANSLTPIPALPVPEAARCGIGQAVPFTRFGPEASPLVISDASGSCIEANGKALNFGLSIPVFESVISETNRIYFAREAFSSHLTVYAFDGTTLTRFNLPREEREALRPEHAFTLSDQAIFIAYNVETSIPEGRQFGALSEGLSLWTADPMTGKLSILKSVTLPGGIDANLQSVNHAGGRLVCQNLSCYQVQKANGVIQVSPIKLAIDATDVQPILVELATDGINAYALVKREYDDRFHNIANITRSPYSVCSLGDGSSCTDWIGTGTPYRLRVSAGDALLDAAQSSVEQADMLRFDLERLRQTGVGYLGENNVEGRVAWGNVYFSNGLITLAANHANLGTDFYTLREDADTRLEMELGLIEDQFGRDTPQMSIRRYSIDRSLLGSLLHAGRVGRLLLRAEDAGVYTMRSNRQTLFDIMQPNPQAIEEIVRNTDTGRVEFRIRRNAAFWADGINTAWNYQSGWVDGLAFLNKVRPDLARPHVPDAAVMMELFVKENELSDLPQVWDYAGGDFYDGWTAADDLSTNTPEFPGDKVNTATAHISYRSMDAIALLEAHREGFVTLDPALIDHMCTLIDTGRLYPFAMEAMSDFDHKIDLYEPLAQGYRRVVYAYDLQSAPWAMKR